MSTIITHPISPTQREVRRAAIKAEKPAAIRKAQAGDDTALQRLLAVETDLRSQGGTGQP